MNTSQLKQHAIDLLKGLIGAVAAAAGLAAANYLGAHIPAFLSFLGTICAATAGVKAGR